MRRARHAVVQCQLQAVDAAMHDAVDAEIFRAVIDEAAKALSAASASDNLDALIGAVSRAERADLSICRICASAVTSAKVLSADVGCRID